MAGKTHIAGDIPLSRAWKAGRRVYVRCARRSRLDDGLYALGSTWDRDEEARWVGSGKLEQVIALIREADAAAEARAAVKERGHWVTIPFPAADVREHAKSPRWDGERGEYDGGRKQWAMPTGDAAAEITAMVAAWEQGAQAEKEARAARDRAARARAAADAARTDDDVIAGSGREVLDAGRVRATIVMSYRGKRPGAEQAKEQRGDVARLRGGRRLLVLSSTVEFWSEDDAEDLGQPGAGAGWRNHVEGVIVGPDEAEAARDAELEAARRDSEQIMTALKDIRGRLAYVPEQDARRAAEDRVTARVSLRYGSPAVHDDGELTLTADGEVSWYHPGYYDDYRASAGSSRDPEAVALARRIFQGGSRERHRDSTVIRVEVRTLAGQEG